MKNRLNEDLKSAMKNKETLRLNTIRLVKKYIQELETSVGHSGTATDAEILKIINGRANPTWEDETEKYYLEKEDMRTAFGCIEYSHGLLDALRMIHGLI